MKKFLLAAAAVAMIGSVSAKEALDTTAMDSLTAAGKGGYCCNYKGYGSSATSLSLAAASASGDYAITKSATVNITYTAQGYSASGALGVASSSSVGTSCGCSYGWSKK
jgi:hypothetical protein